LELFKGLGTGDVGSYVRIHSNSG